MGIISKDCINNTPVKISSVINNDLFVKTSMMG